MDTKNSYKDSKQYLAYCKNTDEKIRLHEFICEAFAVDPVQILDLGCGNGINTAFLADRFSGSLVDAIERSPAQIAVARRQNSRKNTAYQCVSFEEFKTDKKYDFILASHVLQYIDSGLENFVRKACSMLAIDGELWFVQQTKQGMAQIIFHQKQYLINPRFSNWRTFEDYERFIKKIIGGEFQIRTDYLDSSFKGINFANPSDEDKLRLEFIFCLDDSFDEQSLEFKLHLAKLELGKNGRISHPNGIMRIWRIK